jgi:hypothetical protein
VRDFCEAVDARPKPFFRRTLRLESKEPPARLYFRAASGKRLEARDGAFALDSGLRLKVDGAAALVRGTELLVPLEFKEGACTLEVTYQW